MTFPIVGRLQDYPQFVLSLMAKRKRDSSCVLMQNFYEARVPENISKEANLSTKEIISSLWMGRTPAKFSQCLAMAIWAVHSNSSGLVLLCTCLMY